MSNYLTAEQVDQLLSPINPARVLSRDGMAYVAAHDVKAHLTRIFGFGRWSSEVVEQGLVFEQPVTMKNGKDGWNVCYRSVVKLTVCSPDGTVLATFTEGHVGDNTGPTRSDVHGNAVANSESYALKRCAAMLGDQFGLSLYDKGSKRPLVKGTLIHPVVPSEDVNGDTVTSEGLDEGQPVEPEPPVAEPASELPAPVAEQPAPAGEPDAGASSPDAEVGRLRERVIEAMAMPKKDALQSLGRIALDVSKSRLKNAPTTTPAGVPVTVGLLVDQALQFVSGPKPHGIHDDEADREAVAS